MPTISFSLISSSTIKKCKFLEVEDAEAVIDVTGPFQDPTSLQKFRDAVSNSFEAHRKNLSELILKHDATVGEASDVKERTKRVKEFTQQQNGAIKKIEKTLQEKIDALKKKAAEGAQAVALSNTQFTVSVLWSAYKLGKAGYNYFVPTPTPSGGSNMDFAALAKEVYDTLKDLIKLAGEVWEYVKSEEDVRSQIEGTRAAIRKTKGKPTESQVAKLESQLKSHGIKIAALEKKARELSTQLEKLLNKAEQGPEKLADEMSTAIDKSIKQIINVNEGCEKAIDYHKRSQDALRDARKAAVKDPTSIWGIFTQIDGWYEAVDDYFKRVKLENFVDILENTADSLAKSFAELR